MEAPEPFRFEDGRPLAVKPGHLYQLELRDVSFRYPGADRDTLSHVNLTIRPGEKLAVVGKNGAGKTTLIKLLCGLYDPTQGQVLLDGEDIRQYDRRDYYKLFSAVFQQFSVLAGTIAENVAQVQDGDVDRPRMWECLTRAGIADKIRELPQGENTHLGREVYLDGVDLSGGQLQRVLLAMAVMDGPNLLLLDEPVSGVDQNGMELFYRTMEYLKENFDLSIILISHDLEYVEKYADQVILLDQTVVKSGSAKEVFGSREFQDIFGREELPGYVSKKREKRRRM